MDNTSIGKPDRLLQQIAKWRHVGGGVDRDGNKITKPVELGWAEMIESFCVHYHALPSQIMQEDISLLRMHQMLNVGKDNK